MWVDNDQRQRERTCPTYEEALARGESIARDLAAAAHDPDGEDPLPATFGVLVDHYLFGAGRPQNWRSPKSARRMEQVARRILSPTDLELRAEALTGRDGVRSMSVILARAEQLGCVPGGGEFEKAGQFLRAVLQTGARDGLIDLGDDGNPMRQLRYRLADYTAAQDPRLVTVQYVGPELVPPTDRVHDLVDAARRRYNDREALYLSVAAFGGLRPAEVNALCTQHVRTDHSGLLVLQQLLEQRVREAGGTGATQVVAMPKWGLQRTAWLADDVYAELREYADRVADSGDGPGWLFPADRGGLRWTSNYRRDILHPLLEFTGWPCEIVHRNGRMERRWTWNQYSLRHHYAHFLLKTLRQPLVTVARWMGHRDVRVTEAMYVRTELGDLDVASAALTHRGANA